MFDSRLEARRFAPQLRVLVLQGPQRRDQIAAIAEHDLVITTYPLLARDQQAVLAHCYLLLIGMRDSDDEARQGAETGSGNRSGTRNPDTRGCLTGRADRSNQSRRQWPRGWLIGLLLESDSGSDGDDRRPG